jgi:hypothetical protein
MFVINTAWLGTRRDDRRGHGEQAGICLIEEANTDISVSPAGDTLEEARTALRCRADALEAQGCRLKWEEDRCSYIAWDERAQAEEDAEEA